MKGFFSYFIQSYRATFLIILGLAIFGIVSVVNLPREASPEIKIPIAVVVTTYPGASARDVEELVTNEIEERLANLEGLKELQSTSQLSLSTVTVEFAAEEDQVEALRRLREVVDNVTGLPQEAEDPQVIEISFSEQPILSIGLSGIDDSRLLTLYAEQLSDEIEAIPNISSVRVVGAREEEIVVEFEPQVLARYGLSLGQVLQRIRASNVNAPFGQLETDNFGYELRLLGRYSDVSDVADTAIGLNDGSVVPLSTIANVKLALNDSSSESRISVGGNESTNAVTLEVRKKTGGNIIDIVDEVKASAERIREESYPPELSIITFSDSADDIRTSLRTVTQSGLQTLVIVFAILWLFLGIKEAFIASLAVPFTFFMAFIIFDLNGITLNGISLFSLILALGLLVDNAIVITEGIHQKPDNVSLDDHASAIVQTFQKPLMSGTLTTVAAFFPMLLVTGIIGQFLRTIPIVVSATLLSSLIVALAFLPAVASNIMKRFPNKKGNRWFDSYFNRFKQKYVTFIEYALDHRSFQNKFIAILTALMVIGLSLPFTGLLSTGLFPAVDIDFIIGNVELSPGSRTEATARVMNEVEQELRAIPEIGSFVMNIGSSTSVDVGGGTSSEHLGSFFINLNKDRGRTSIDITEDLRQAVSHIQGGKITITDVSAGPPTASPVELRVVGNDLGELDRLSGEIMSIISSIPGAVEVDRDLRNSAGEFNFILDQRALAKYNLSNADVAQTLRIAKFGVEVTTFLDKTGNEIPVRIAVSKDAISGIDSLLALPISTPSGESVTLSQIATVDLSTSINVIRHRDEDRSVTISAKAREGFNPNAITAQLQEELRGYTLPAGYSIQFGGEQQETQETFIQLYQSMIIAVIAILMILVIEFNSYRQPLIIFLSIPLALIGVLFGLLITGGQLNFSAFIGLVSLTGIVVNNAILLVDRMNARKEAGATTIDAVREATASRLRPIILTTLTTAAGVAPLIWVDEFFRDLALTIVTGLLFSTVITLVLIPILYLRQQDKLDAKQA